jgi:hypothetical protein
MKVREWKPVFLDQLRKTGIVSEAARAAGIARKTAYKHRNQTDSFKEEWDEALEEACDSLESEARRRAVEGVDHPVIYQGEITATYKDYSDTLLIFLLKVHRYPDKVDITSGGKSLFDMKSWMSERSKRLSEVEGLTDYSDDTEDPEGAVRG